MRPRRNILIGTALSLVLAGVLSARLDTAGGAAGRGVPQQSHHRTLPSSALFNQISVTPGGLLISGVTLATANSRTPTCAAAHVNPKTLHVGKILTGSCADPRLAGHTVEAVMKPVPRSNNATLSVGSVNPKTGRVTLGPVLMTYGSYSDTHPVMAYGGGWLWIYDVDTTSGPELLQVSEQSGTVIDHSPMPKLYRPLLAADDEGVWLANSISGSPGPALSYVPAEHLAPFTVNADTALPICWLTADGTSAWVGTGVGWNCGHQMVEKYVDGADEPAYSLPGRAGFTPFSVVGSQSGGLWGMQWTQPVSPGAAGPQQVFFIDPDTGAETVTATLPPVVLPNGVPTDGLVPGQAVYFDGALFLLEPPFRLQGWSGYTSLVRVPAQRTP